MAKQRLYRATSATTWERVLVPEGDKAPKDCHPTFEAALKAWKEPKGNKPVAAGVPLEDDGSAAASTAGDPAAGQPTTSSETGKPAAGD